MTSTIIHPIFFKCKDYTLDPFWKDIFDRCSCNRFPKNVRYEGRKNTLYVKLPGGIGGKKEIFTLSKEPTEAFETMMSVFRDIGLRSQRDLEFEQDEMNKARDERRVNLDCSWKDLKPRYLKDRMIVKYVLRIKKEFNLDTKEAKRLLNTIQLGFQLKQLTSDDVKYKNGAILDIEGLDHKNCYVDREIKRHNKNTKANTTNHFLQIFENYMKESRKRSIFI